MCHFSISPLLLLGGGNLDGLGLHGSLDLRGGLLCRGLLGRGLLRLGLLAYSGDVGDADLRQVLTVALQALVALTLLELEDDGFFALELLNDFAGDLGGGKRSRIDGDLFTIGQENDVESNALADSGIELLNYNDIAGRDLELLAAGGNDCVHA